MHEQIKELVTILLSLIGTILAIYALILSRKTSKRTSKIESSNILSNIHEKISESRRIMQDIYRQWTESTNYKIKPEELLLSENEKHKISFMDYYNTSFHRQPVATTERNLSNQIHKYLHELHYLFVRYLNNEFSEKEIMNKFQVALTMDSALLQLYLHAHWLEHNQFDLELKERFWFHVLEFIVLAEKWKNNNKNNNT